MFQPELCGFFPKTRWSFLTLKVPWVLVCISSFIMSLSVLTSFNLSIALQTDSGQPLYCCLHFCHEAIFFPIKKQNCFCIFQSKLRYRIFLNSCFMRKCIYKHFCTTVLFIYSHCFLLFFFPFLLSQHLIFFPMEHPVNKGCSQSTSSFPNHHSMHCRVGLVLCSPLGFFLPDVLSRENIGTEWTWRLSTTPTTFPSWKMWG